MGLRRPIPQEMHTRYRRIMTPGALGEPELLSMSLPEFGESENGLICKTTTGYG